MALAKNHQANNNRQKTLFMITATQHNIEQLSNLTVRLDTDREIATFSMSPRPRPTFNIDLLKDLKYAYSLTLSNKLKYIIFSSDIDGIFNLGGDLKLFAHLIQSRKVDSLKDYMELCLSVLHPAELENSDVQRIAVVQGAALGGGFESALCCDFIIAETGAYFGFPEILFNLFPGMGAYSYLIRRTTPTISRNILTSGKRYSAQEMLAMGVIDQVVEKGSAFGAAHEYIRQHKRHQTAYNAIRHVQQIIQPLHYDELLAIGKTWVDAAMRLSGRDLRLMNKIGERQLRAIKR